VTVPEWVPRGAPFLGDAGEWPVRRFGLLLPALQVFQGGIPNPSVDVEAFLAEHGAGDCIP
jgi:hypothetical protein